MISFCQMTYDERLDQTLTCIKRVSPYVDRCVIIVDQSIVDSGVPGSTVISQYTSHTVDKMNEINGYNNTTIVFSKWEDLWPKQRNVYLGETRDDWILVSDPDELFCEELMQDVRSIVADVDAKGITQLLVNSHDISHDADGETRTAISTFHKALIFKNTPDVKYTGTVHETLLGNWKPMALDPKYYYEHSKFYWEVWERAARNVFCGGGGNNSGVANRSWTPLRELCKELELYHWAEARAYFRKGKVDPRLIQWLYDNRFDGTDYEHEMMEFGRWYFEYLHPEENTINWAPLKQHTIMDRIHQTVYDDYLDILGRHPDPPGLEQYAQALESGALTRVQFRQILRSSDEFIQKFTGDI